MSRRRNRRLVAASPVLAPSIRRTVGTDPSLRTMTLVTMRPSTQRRSRAGKMTGAQRNSEGRRSEWTLSQNNRDGRDPKWDRTVSQG